MGLQLPARRAPTRRARRSLLASCSLLLSGCSDDTEDGERLAMPDPASEQGEHILDLWQGAWIAALVTGVVVWGLIFYAWSASAAAATTRSRSRPATTCRSRSSTRSPR